MTGPPTENGRYQRKRRTHQKSRRGCRNCKLRRVKCDETRPECSKCSNFGVACNYNDPTAPDLQMSFNGAAVGTAIKTSPQKPPCSNSVTFFMGQVEIPECLSPGVTCISDNGSSRIQLDRECLGRLDRFVKRTVLTVGPPNSAGMFQSEMVELACANPYLMHMVQALTALHDRHLSPMPNSRHTNAELYHVSRAAALFNAKLSSPLQPEDRDSLWATAALFGITAMCWMEASCAEEAWPLTPREPTDLDWIRMSESKTVVWDLTGLPNEGSRFKSMTEVYLRSHETLEAMKSLIGFGGLPSGLASVCEVSEQSTAENNPYFRALQGLALALAVENTRANVLALISFIGYMGSHFQYLLKDRDPRALLILAYWYAKVRDTLWWLDRRSLLECQAICLYLERYHADQTAVLELLSFPKMRCGLVD